MKFIIHINFSLHFTTIQVSNELAVIRAKPKTKDQKSVLNDTSVRGPRPRTRTTTPTPVLITIYSDNYNLPFDILFDPISAEMI